MRFLSCLLVLALAGQVLGAGAPDLPAAQPGHVLVLRHARAPGVGDPSGMVLGDCGTQRNLDDRGRAQARRLGERLRGAGFTEARVFTSQWCRCRETARLLGLGPVEDLPALNSFFAEPSRRAAQTRAWREVLDRLPRAGAPVVFVSHQVNITALTGSFPDSGEGCLLRLLPEGGFTLVANVSIPE